MSAASPFGSPFGSEDAFLAAIARHFPDAGNPLGRADDCAVLDLPGRICLSADLFVENVHFRQTYFSPADVGWKALAVNVSDIAAMGARPLGFALQLFGPAATPAAWWDDLLAGMARMAAGLPLVGGDLSLGPCIGLAVTIWGAAGPAGRLLQRRATRPGDVLFVVGELGLARAGLAALERHGRAALNAFPAACAAHLRPVSRIAAGLELAANPAVRGCMDLSDGLASDLPRFLAPGHGAELQLADCHPEVAACAAASGQDPAVAAFLGGEDYALLAAAEAGAALPAGARAIGRVTDGPGILLNGRPAPASGFDHFGG